MNTPLASRRRGMTIVEVLVAVICASVIGAAIANVVRAGANTNAFVMDRTSAVATSRILVDILTDGWRTNAQSAATFEPGLRGAKGLTAGGASDITYTDNNGTAIRYWKQEQKLMRQVAGQPSTGQIVASNMSGLVFYYLPSGSTTWQTSATTPSAIRAITFTVTATTNGMSRQTSGMVRLRQQ